MKRPYAVGGQDAGELVVRLHVDKHALCGRHTARARQAVAERDGGLAQAPPRAVLNVGLPGEMWHGSVQTLSDS